MAGAQVADPQVVDPGPAGGQTQCGQDTNEMLCTWTDSATTGSVVASLTSSLSIEQLASLTLAFRVDAEH